MSKSGISPCIQARILRLAPLMSVNGLLLMAARYPVRILQACPDSRMTETEVIEELVRAALQKAGRERTAGEAPAVRLS